MRRVPYIARRHDSQSICISIHGLKLSFFFRTIQTASNLIIDVLGLNLLKIKYLINLFTITEIN